MFKKILRQITEIKTAADLNECCGEIDRAYQSGKINWKDNELLYAVIAMASRNLPEYQ